MKHFKDDDASPFHDKITVYIEQWLVDTSRQKNVPGSVRHKQLRYDPIPIRPLYI